MLVLTRKEKQKIRLGENIVITVVRLKNKAVQIGIEAPLEVRVMRGELLERSSNHSPSKPTRSAHRPHNMQDKSRAAWKSPPRPSGQRRAGTIQRLGASD